MSLISRWANVLAVALALSLFSVTSHAQVPLKGALCVLNLDEQIVLVDELLTGKLSLPGGTIMGDEDPKWTAERETWEETGLAVSATHVLKTDAEVVYYHCSSDSEVYVYSQPNAFGGHSMPAWFADHFGIEVRDAFIIDPTRVEVSDYRYPEKWQDVVGLFAQTTSQPVTEVANTINLAPMVQQLELAAFNTVQQNASYSELRARLSFLLMLFSQPVWLLALFPLAYAKYGQTVAIRLLFVTATTSLIALVSQFGFALPAPWAYLGTATAYSTSGFQFPSLPVALITAIAVVIARSEAWQWRSRNSLIAVAAAVGYALLSVVSGNGFISDALGGAVLGALVAWHFVRLEKYPDIKVDQLLSSSGVWVLLTLASLLAMLFWSSAALTSWFAVLMVLAVVIKLERRSQLSAMQGWALSALIVVIYAVFALATYWVTDFGHYLALLLNVASYPIMTLVLALGLRKK